MFIEVMLQGWQKCCTSSPSAFETSLGWVLTCSSGGDSVPNHALSCPTLNISNDDILQRFWELEECLTHSRILTAEESFVIKHFNENYSHTDDGRFIVPLPLKPNAGVLGVSGSTAVRQFLALKHSLHHKGHFSEFSAAIQEYFDMGHAEEVPLSAICMQSGKTPAPPPS